MKARVLKDLLIAQFWFVIVLGPGLSDSMAQEKEGLVEVRALLNPAVGAVPGERVEIEITVATPRWFTAGTRISLPEVPDLVLVQNQDFAANATERREGESWSVQRWSIDAFATRDGTLRIPPIDVTVSVSASAAREHQTTLQTESLTLTIEQPPELEGLDHWIASPEVTITQNVEGAREVFLGSAITRRVTVRAEDVMAMFLPSLDDPRVEGLQTYPQPPVLRNSSNRGSLIAERKELTTWIASTPGDLVIPEVSINWWNTATRRLERLSTAPIPITVQGQLPPKVLTWQQQIARALPWLVGLGIASALVLLGVYGQLARARRPLSKLAGLVYRSWHAWRQPVLADRLNPEGCAEDRD